MFKTIATRVASKALAALAVVTLVFTTTSCGELMNAGEERKEMMKSAHLFGSPKESLVEVPSFNGESSNLVSVPSVAEYDFTNEDGNVVSFKGLNCTINSVTVNYDEPVNNSRTVYVTAFGTPDELAEVEGGGKEVVATCSYTQMVPADKYTYDVIPTVNSNDDTSQARTSYEVKRYHNGTLDQTWKFSVTDYEYTAYTGSDNLYTAASADWTAAITLPEGDAVNSLGNPIKVQHGTTVAKKSVIAKIWKDGAFVTTDNTCVTMTETEKYYYGDFTFCSTAKRISCDGNYRLVTSSNVVFEDTLTGHREVLVGDTESELSMVETGVKYVKNPNAVASISDSEGKNYNYVGDYTVPVDVKINGTKVCSSNTVFPTYSLVK